MSIRDDKLTLIFMRERASLSRYLAARSSSPEEGEDLVQEVWIRFASSGAASVSSPVSYLRKIAKNLSIDYNRSVSKRLLRRAEIDELLSIPDETPNQEAALSSKQDVSRLAEIIDELPARRRQILIATRLNQEPYKVIAQQHGVSIRTIEMEVRAALEYCSRRMSDDV